MKLSKRALLLVFTAVTLLLTAAAVQSQDYRWLAGEIELTAGDEAPSHTPVERAGAMHLRHDTGQTWGWDTDADAWVASVSGVGGGYKIARGSVTLDGSNPSSAATGLATIVECFITNERTTAPGDETSVFTWGNTGATIDIYAWVHAAADPTLAASTDANDTVSWFCIGT